VLVFGFFSFIDTRNWDRGGEANTPKYQRNGNRDRYDSPFSQTSAPELTYTPNHIVQAQD
jgi:hypothetical protein